MKKFLLLGLVFLISLSIFTPEKASANTLTNNVDDFYSQVKVFDGNNKQVEYTLEEIKKMVRFEENVMAPFSKYTTYDYGAVTFSSNFYIGPMSNGKAFFNPADTLFTVNGTASAIRVNAYNDTGTGSGTLARSLQIPGGWSGTIHMSGWTTLPRGKSYRFKVLNEGKKFTINKTQVWYNWQG